MKLQPEEGTTEVSLENAAIIIKRHGQPIMLDFHAHQKKCDYTVITTWEDGYKFTFTGFAWGYGGTAPAGLAEFLKLIDCPISVDQIPLDKYGRTEAAWWRPGTYRLSWNPRTGSYEYSPRHHEDRP